MNSITNTADSLQEKVNTLLATVLKDILDEHKNLVEKGKTMLCLEGLSREVYSQLKLLFPNDADIFWANDVAGDELVRHRNDADSSKPMVIFIDSYFPESQSLAHLNRISDLDLMREERWRNRLIDVAFPGGTENKTTIESVIGAIADILTPTICQLCEYILEVERLVQGGQNVAESLGKSLWKVKLFSHEKLAKKFQNENVDELRKTLKKNQTYASAVYRTRFTSERIYRSKLDGDSKNILFNYSKGIDIEECYKKIAFEEIRRLFAKGRRFSDSENDEDGEADSEEKIPLQKSSKEAVSKILEKIVGLADNYEEELDIQFGYQNQIRLSISPLDSQNLFNVHPGFRKWEVASPESSQDDDDDETDNVIAVPVRVKQNSRKKNINFSFRPPALIFENTKSVRDEWEKVSAGLTKEEKNDLVDELIRLVNEFIKQQAKINEGLKRGGGITLHLDVEAYLRSYLDLFSFTWANTRKLARKPWFQKFRKDLFRLGLQKDDKRGNIQIRSTHPFKLFTQRITEALALELIGHTWAFEKVSPGEDETFLEAIQRDAREQFGKCWPRFFAWERGQDPYIVDYGDDNVGYRPCKKPELARTHLIRVLNPLILNYLSRNPLAQHTLHLKVLNPYNGKALFEALRDLYKKRQNITIPGSIFLTALCDNKNHTLSAFDDAAEKRESEEIFKILPQRLQPACYYKKKPFGIQDWMNKKKQISNYKNDPEEIDKADICLAIDPYIDEYSISDSLMSDETGAGIDRYLEDYEKNKNSPKDGKNPLLERMAGVDRIYLRLAFESLSVMIANEGEERRRFDKSTISKERYVDLMKALLNSGVWAVLMDRDMNDYYAGECSDKLAKELNKKVKSYVDESGTGTAYLFIAPDEGDNSKSIGYIPNNLSENSSFTGWFDGTYRDFSQNEDFCRLYFRTERQFLIPLNLLPSWFHKALVEFPGANADENENADAEAEDLQQSPQRYILRLLFDMEKDQKNINLAADLWQLKKEKFSQVSSVGDKIDLAFLFTGDSNGMTGKAWLFNELKRRVLINTLHSLVANPYQSWFSALLRRWSDNNFIENKELLEARRLNDDNVKGNTSIGKIRFWELRLLSIYLLRLYSPYNDIDIDISREDKQVWMGFCDTLKKYCRDFLVDLKAHLMERNGELKPRHSFLNWYV